MDKISKNGIESPKCNELTIHRKQKQVLETSSNHCKKSNLDISLSSQSTTSETSSQGHSSSPDVNNTIAGSVLISTAYNDEEVCDILEEDHKKELQKATLPIHEETSPSKTRTQSLIAKYDQAENLGKEYNLTRFACSEIKCRSSPGETSTTAKVQKQQSSTEDDVKTFINPLSVDTLTNEKKEKDTEETTVFKKHGTDNDFTKPPIKPFSPDEMKSDRNTWGGERKNKWSLVLNKQPLSNKDKQTVLQFSQARPPKEVTLQATALPSLVRNANTPGFENLVTHQNQDNDTPPPSYQESSRYPLVQTCQCQPLDFVSVEAMSSNRTREPGVAFIKRNNSRSQTRCHSPSTSDNSTRDGVFIVQSISDEVCNGNNRDPYSDHQILALLSCIIFWPIGLVAVYYANMANVLQAEGIHRKAMEYSKRAVMLSLLSLAMGTIVLVTFYIQRKIPI